MTRSVKVLNHGVMAGILEQVEDGYRFTYDKAYLADSSRRAICLTMPKQAEIYTSEHMFPFFHGLLAEGVTKDLQCRQLKIDENDHFGRLSRTADSDVIGSVTIEELDEE
jgi:HipA-like protein